MNHLDMVRGDTAEFEMEVIDPITDEPKDLTGATATFAGRLGYSTDPIINVSSPTDITIGAEGLVHIKVPSAQTAELPNDIERLYWDLQVEADGNKWTVASGTLGILPEVVVP